MNTQKMAFLVKNECKNLLLIEKLVVPEACDISPQIIQVQAGFTWPYCRVLKIFNKSSINFAIFWSNFKIFPLAFEVSKPKNVKKCKIHGITHFFYLLIYFFRLLMSFYSLLATFISLNSATLISEFIFISVDPGSDL